MKLSLLAAALVAIALTACDRPKQALPENSTTYGTRTEEGSTLDQERKGTPSEQTAAAPAPKAKMNLPAKPCFPAMHLMATATPCRRAKAPFPQATRNNRA